MARGCRAAPARSASSPTRSTGRRRAEPALTPPATPLAGIAPLGAIAAAVTAAAPAAGRRMLLAQGAGLPVLFELVVVGAGRTRLGLRLRRLLDAVPAAVVVFLPAAVGVLVDVAVGAGIDIAARPFHRGGVVAALAVHRRALRAG